MWEPKELRLDWRHPWARTVGACRIRVFGGLRPGRDQGLHHIQRRSPTPSVPVWSLSSLSLSSLSLSLSSLSGLVACRVVPVSSGLVDVSAAVAVSPRGRAAVATPHVDHIFEEILGPAPSRKSLSKAQREKKKRRSRNERRKARASAAAAVDTSLRDRLSAAKAEVGRLREENGRLTVTNAGLADTTVDLSVDAELRITTLQADHEVRVATVLAKQRERYLAKLAAARIHRQHVVALLNIELGRRKSDVDRLCKERDELREERASLQSELKTAKKRIEELRESRRLVFPGPTPRPSE